MSCVFVESSDPSSVPQNTRAQPFLLWIYSVTYKAIPSIVARLLELGSFIWMLEFDEMSRLVSATPR